MGYKADAAKGIAWGWLLLIIFIVIAVVTSAGLWLFGVATSGIKGQGDATKINNSAENWTEKQKLFHTKYQAVEGAKQKISVYKASVASATTPGEKKTAQTNLDGMISQCINYATEYNTETSAVLSRDWKDPELPYNINPVTECK